MISIKTITRPGEGGLTLAKLASEFRRVRKAYVKAGVLGNAAALEDAETGMTNARLAAIHEYGLNVPARPWIGPPFRKNRDVYLRMLRDSYAAALKKGKPSQVTTTLDIIGFKMVADIKNYVTQGAGVPPPLAASTIRRKGSSRPLVDTAAMLNSVTHKVFDGSTHGSMHSAV